MAGPLLIPLLVAGTQIASSIFSFSAAAKARDKESKAQRAAAKAMAHARKELEVNYFKGLSLSKEAYDLEFEKMAVLGTSALQAGTEGDQRGVGAVVGRVGQLISEQAKQQRVDMAREMTAFKVAAAKEETNLQKMKVALDAGEAEGAQKAAQDAAMMAQYNTQQGVQQLAKGVSGGLTSGVFDKKDITSQDPFRFDEFSDWRPDFINERGKFEGFDRDYTDPYALWQKIYGLQGVTIEDTISQKSLFPSESMRV